MNDHSMRLGTEHIPPLLARLSLPAMTGLVVQALYNVTDGVFVGRLVGSEALAGITIAMPIQMIVIAIAQTFGIGGASIISRALGAGDQERANRTLGSLFTTTVLCSAVVAVCGTLFLAPLLRLFGASQAVLPLAADYLRVILWGGPFFMFAMMTTAIVRAEGNARVAMWTMIIAGLLNIGLDILFIYALRWGVAGAAWATVLSQATTVVYLVVYFVRGRSVLRVRRPDFVPSLSLVRESFAIGIGSFARMVAGSFAVTFINRSLGGLGGDAAITAYGIINRVFQFLFMPMLGIVQGMMPIVGYNIGAGAPDRARLAIRLSISVATILSVVAAAILFLAPRMLLGIFTSDETVIGLGISAIRTLVIGLPTVGFQFVAGGVFQALGKALPALVLALLRQVLLLMPLIWILREAIGLAGVWTAFPVADLVSALVTVLLFVRIMRELSRRSAGLPTP